MDDCFDKILEANSKSEVTKYKVIIELMKDLENGLSNALRVRNCLIFLLNLSFNDAHGDYLDRIGKRSEELNEEDKFEMYKLLRWECNN
ncbi:MAG: hypothetical protein ACW98X_01035 [Promethearchaeota archaeon]|jgi:hypothetical protein